MWKQKKFLVLEIFVPNTQQVQVRWVQKGERSLYF